mgnify:FL=1|tara:strand:+ start:38912 stop:39184 length:273 start_codon:yes stop_codon:yes gene_type:complete
MKNKPANISNKAQLIEGIGASSWFTIESENKNYRIERFSLSGIRECSKRFKVFPKGFEISKPYHFTYLSHCQECTILQENKTFKFYAYDN